MFKTRVLILPLAIASVLAACTHPGSVDSGAVSAARESLPVQPITWAAVQQETGEVSVGWIAAFKDPVLEKLVTEALQHNRNLQAAAANIEASRALARQAGAALKPTVGLSAGGQRGGTVNSDAAGSLNVGLQASWELDVWNRIGSGEQAAVASLEAAQADYRFSQYSLAAGVAGAYFIAIESELQKNLTRSLVDSVLQTRRIVETQFRNGLASAQDVALVKADLATAREGLAAAEGGQRDAIRALELLLGRYPEAELTLRNSLPALPEPPGAGVPSEVLERRPDLIAAERRIAAAMNVTNQAKAARLPQISLTGSVGGSSPQLSSLLNPGNLAWQAATSLLVPLIDGGARQAQVEVSTAEQKAAVAAYAQAALVAFSEVETALDQRLNLQRREASLAQATNQSREALRLAKLRFKEGESDLIDVLTVQQRVDSAQSNHLSLQRAQLQQFVDLNLALGGDWQTRPAKN